MGSLCCCCKSNDKKDSKETEKRVEKKSSNEPIVESDNNIIPYYKSEVVEERDEIKVEPQKDIMDIEKLREERRKSFRAGSSGYMKTTAILQRPQKGEDMKELSPEFKRICSYLEKRGYKEVFLIGSGNYSRVYFANYVVSKKKGKEVAIKVIDLKTSEEYYRKDFLPQEIKIIRELKHKNIIKIYEILQAENKIYMIMEYAKNKTLLDWLQKFGTLTENIAHPMFKQILEAIDFMHNRLIAHRDLKIENILLNANNNPLISDFSFAVFVNPKNPLSETFCGTLPYFPPEILQTQPYNPLISDIWSLGICFYIMLNDGLPFKLEDKRLMLCQQLTKDWKFRSKINISEDLKSMIRKMLEPDTSTRITSSQLIRDNWVQNYKSK